MPFIPFRRSPRRTSVYFGNVAVYYKPVDVEYIDPIEPYPGAEAWIVVSATPTSRSSKYGALGTKDGETWHYLYGDSAYARADRSLTGLAKPGAADLTKRLWVGRLVSLTMELQQSLRAIVSNELEQL